MKEQAAGSHGDGAYGDQTGLAESMHIRLMRARELVEGEMWKYRQNSKHHAAAPSEQ